MNINGNWSAGASFEFMGTVDKKKRLMLNTKTEVGYNNSVDYVAVDGQSADSPRSSVRSAKADETLTLDYSLGKYAFGAKLRCAYLHAESPRSDFQTINSFSFSANSRNSRLISVSITSSAHYSSWHSS